MIADIEGDFASIIGNNTPDSAPILPVRNLVLFPGVVTPILIGRPSSKQLVQKAEKKSTIICVVPQRDPDVDLPLRDSLTLNARWLLPRNGRMNFGSRSRMPRQKSRRSH